MSESTINKTDLSLEKKKLSKDALLNTISNVLFLFCLWLMTMITPKISAGGFDDAGVFTLALSVANIATAVAVYNISSFFASDINDRFKDNHYFYFGMTSSLISLVVSVVVCFIYGYSPNVFLAIILYNVFKMFDNYSYVTRIIYQKHGHLPTFSYLLIVRSVLSIGLFVASLLISKSFVISMACMAVFGAAYFFVELFFLNRKCPKFYIFNKDVYKISLSIFYHALPSFIYGMCIAAITSVPRLIFENVSQNTTLLGYFGTMSSVTALIQSVASAAFLPFIPKITKAYQDGERTTFIKYMLVLLALIGFLTAAAFFAVFFLGDWALKFIYGDEILGYSSIFKWLVLSAGLQAIVIIMADTLVSLRKFVNLLIGSLAGVVMMGALSFVLIKTYSDYGVLYAYLISHGTCFIIFIVSLLIIVSKITKPQQTISEE